MDKSLLKPKYWGISILIGISKILVNTLSYKALMHLAVFIGYLTKPIIKKRQKITMINLRITFPEKSDKEIKKLANKSYKSACMAGFKSLIAWFMSEKNFKKIKFDDSELTTFIDAHNDKSSPTICLGFHFHTLEIVGRHSGINYSPLTLMYQMHKNPLMEHLITSSRKKYVNECFQRKSTLWYAPDQDFKEHIVFVPFFGKLCSTLKVTPWLAQKTGAVVVPTYYVRNPDLSGYRIISGDPFVFTGDDHEDAIMTNRFLENAIRKYPEQYLWQHRRYKTRPAGEEKIY